VQGEETHSVFYISENPLDHTAYITVGRNIHADRQTCFHSVQHSRGELGSAVIVGGVL